MDKKYIVITDAKRLGIDSTSTSYRRGELALLNPSILDFYANLEENMKNVTAKRDEAGKIVSYSTSPSFGYEHQQDNIPALMHNKTMWGWTEDRMPNYFLITLRNNEFTAIPGTSLDQVKDGVKRIYDEMGYTIKDGLFSCVEHIWRNLEAFDLLIGNKIHELEMEVRSMPIGEEEYNKRVLDSINYHRELDGLPPTRGSGLMRLIR